MNLTNEADLALIALIAGGFRGHCHDCDWLLTSAHVIDIDSTTSPFQSWLDVECPNCRRITLRRHVYPS